MPWENHWIANEVAFEIDGITIYHTYKDDELEQGVSSDTFTLEEFGCEDDANISIKNYPMPDSYEGRKEHPQFTCKPNNWQGSYDEWTASDLYQELEEAWADWHATRSGRYKAILTNAIALKLAPFDRTPIDTQEG